LDFLVDFDFLFFIFYFILFYFSFQVDKRAVPLSLS